jgi:dipeptidyl aminopeptidase/acylaminoacyl peptidase
MAATVAPYGSWRSPITVDLLVGATVGLTYPDVSARGVSWLENRPEEGGRSILVFREDGREPVDVVPAGFNVRTRVHEYGGGASWRHGDVAFVSSFDDGRVYRVESVGSEPRPVTPEPAEANALRYADGAVTSDGGLVVCVRERHEGGEVLNELVAFPADGSAEPRVIASGHDFYAAPRLDPAGERLAWLTWDHPNMPFDEAELHLASFAADGTLGDERVVAGGESESVVDPRWSPEGVLHFVSDRTGWSNLYRISGDHMRPLAPTEGAFAEPWWVFARERYAFLPDGRIACIVTRGARDSLELLDPGSGSLERVDLPYTAYSSGVSAQGNRIAFVAAAPTSAAALVRYDVAAGAEEVVARSSSVEVDEAYVSPARAIEFPGSGGETAHAFFYPPRNAHFGAPEGELPPLVVEVHGGPTAHSTDGLDLGIQYYTSRGIAVVDVNYGGSSGYGRDYRRRLLGQWGVVDVEDCIAAARYLAEQGEADPDRLLITGGSAGGYTTLLALAIRDDFTAGISAFGVADLELLHQDTHKFESHYESSLVGPYPEERELWRERSPINHADGISAPLLLHQGLDDKVVPPSQSETIVAALKRRGIPYAYLAYEGEGHGFRRADSQRRMYEANLAFMGQVFGFAPADELEPLAIEYLEHVVH